jgi:hypothetical protein
MSNDNGGIISLRAIVGTLPKRHQQLLKEHMYLFTEYDWQLCIQYPAYLQVMVALAQSS